LKKDNRGITLIALVITIIVLLILAAVSISTLTGENGLLTKASDAKTKTVNANIFEQLQIEEMSHKTDKAAGTTTKSFIEYLKDKFIITAIDEENGIWLIDVEKLLGSKQSLGNGTYPNDVYTLEQENPPTGSLINTKIASTTPIKVAETTTSKTYKVVYHGNSTSEELVIGSLSDGFAGNETDDYDKIYAYFYGKKPNDFSEWDNFNHKVIYKDNTTVGILGSEITKIGGKDSSRTGSYIYIEYNNNIYVFDYDYATDKVTAIEKMNIDKKTFGEQGTGEKKVLVTPSTPNNLIHVNYDNSKTYENMYYLKDNGEDINLERTFTGSVYRADGLYYNNSGANIPVIQISGPQTYENVYYLKDNGEIDYDKPCTEELYYAGDTGRYYDTSGALVRVWVKPGSIK